MSYEIQVRRAAELDIAEAQIWYESQQVGLGAEFSSEISRVIDPLAETPFLYQVIHRDVRRAIVHRFPYLIWYQVAGQVVTILACTHAKRDPEQVRDRLSDA